MILKRYLPLILFIVLSLLFICCTDPPGTELSGTLTASMSSLSGSVTNEDYAEILITFSQSVTGLNYGDFTVTNGSVSSFAGSGNEYTITVTPDSDGTVTVILVENSATSSSTGEGCPEAVFSIVFDRESPLPPSIEGISAGTYGSVQTFTLSGIETGAAAEYSIDSGTSWNDYSGGVELVIPDDYTVTARQTDKAGNISASASSISVTITPSYTLTLTVQPHGTIMAGSETCDSSGSPYYFSAADGAVISISATGSDFGYYGCSWSGIDSASVNGSYPDFSVTMDSDKYITAVFGYDGSMVFVSKAGNDTSGTGSIDAPYLTVAKAVSEAASDADIYIAEGTYSEAVAVNKSVSLYGGYNQNDWEERDTGTYTTTIHQSGSAALTLDGGDITASNCIDGFTITGGVICSGGSYPTISNNNITGISASSAAAVSCTSGSGAVITGNILTGGSGSAASSEGVYILNGSGGEISYNTIDAGGADDYLMAVRIDATPNVSVHHNFLTPGGAGNTSWGVLIAESSGVAVYNNVIFGGGSSIENYGIQVANSGGAVIQNNTIDGGNSGSATNYGVADLYTGQGTQIENNLIFFTSGATQNGIYSDSSSVSNNSVWDCLDPYNHDFNNGNTLFSGDPGLGGPTGMELVSTSDNSIFNLGKTIPSITDDIAGTARTVSYSAGAYEYDQ